MSEIQSIATNNYVLQGTVSTSAGIIGDGSPNNPLRADETVLWSNSAGATTGDLSEQVSAFEKIKLYAFQKDSSYRKCYNECYVVNNHIEPGFTYLFNNGTNIYMFYGVYNVSGNSFTYLNGGYERAAIGGNNSATPIFTLTSNDAIKIYKVVGFNRINNS